MMACLSTEPAGTPGRLSGKSCGNWLFCRSSRISSKLSNSLPGCNKEHTNPQYSSLLACCWPSQAPPSVTAAAAADVSGNSPDGKAAHKPLEGNCAGFQGSSTLLLGSPVCHGHPSKPRTGTYHSIPWATGGFLPVHSVISADSRDNRRARSAEDGGLCRYNQYFFQHSCISSLFMT